MIRGDFVSNSSSSSYVISLNTKKNTLENFIDTICKNTLSVDKEYKIDKLDEINKVILKYCLEYYRLLYLGEAYVKDHVYIIDRDQCPDYEELDYYQEMFDGIKRDIDKHGKNNVFTQYDTTYKLLSDTKIEATEKLYLYGQVFDRYTRDFDYAVHNLDKVDENNKDFYKNINDCTIDNIRELNELMCTDDGAKYYSFRRNLPEIYIIDQATIDITRLMLNSGFKMRFDKWQDLDKLENMIQNGNVIMYIRVANSGDGMSNNYIYTQSDKYIFSGTHVKVLSDCCM